MDKKGTISTSFGLTALEKAIGEDFASARNVGGWCRMCRNLAHYVRLHTQTMDSSLSSKVALRQAVGYLMLSPKRLTGEALRREVELRSVTCFVEQECNAMCEAFGELETALHTWAVELDGDEDEPLYADTRDAFAAFVCKFHETGSDARKMLFKTSLGYPSFRSYFFKALGKNIAEGPLAPPDAKADAGAAAEDAAGAAGGGLSEYEARSLGYQERIAKGVGIMSGGERAVNASHRRAGTADEILQENEVERRFRANGGMNLRGLVAQVLRAREWRLPHGHPSTEAGLAKCYNRVYALLNPTRRRAKRETPSYAPPPVAPPEA